jgi:hypothetical protein
MHLEFGNIGALSHGRVGRASAANDEASKVMTSIDTLVDVLNALSVETKETTAETVTSTIGVNNLTGSNFVNGVDGNLVTDSNNGFFSTLSEDNDTGALGVSLGELSELDSNLLEVLSAPASNLGVAASLIFITKDDISIVENSIKTVSEGKSNPGSRKVHGEGLVGLSSVLANSQAGGITTIMGNEESANVKVLCALNDLPVLGLLESLNRELFRSRQVGTKESVKGRRKMT